MVLATKETNKCKELSFQEYTDLLKYNRNYRLYLLSHCMQHTGDWFVRIALLLAVERLDPDSATAISLIVLCKTIPEVFVTPLGGILSDRYDRKRLMIVLDSVASACTLTFVLAIWSGNVLYLFAATTLRACIVSLYEPVTKSIFPMFMENPEDLKRAATLNNSAWSGMLLLGGVFGGYAAAFIGIEACFVIDSITFIISAKIMSKVTGTYCVAQIKNNDEGGSTQHSSSDTKGGDKSNGVDRIKIQIRAAISAVKSFFNMSMDFGVYLWTCGFGLCAFMKACGTATWGSSDVLNASFSLVEGDEAETSRRMGIIFSCAGFGCFIGPFLSNATIIRGDKPHTLQLACIGAFLFLVTGWLGIANAPSFEVICAFTILRCIGEAIIWMNATLLLQTLTSPVMLGRMLGFEYSVARITESIISYTAGRLEDIGYGKHMIASLSASVGGIAFTFWSAYHLFGGGAANKILAQPTVKETELMSQRNQERMEIL